MQLENFGALAVFAIKQALFSIVLGFQSRENMERISNFPLKSVGESREA